MLWVLVRRASVKKKEKYQHVISMVEKYPMKSNGLVSYSYFFHNVQFLRYMVRSVRIFRGNIVLIYQCLGCFQSIIKFKEKPLLGHHFEK